VQALVERLEDDAESSLPENLFHLIGPKLTEKAGLYGRSQERKLIQVTGC
jgi:hypothetical protein